ncbi:MAG: hypothetical protein JRI68_13320 [Deltaproteobacteria bacterium]|nr:hypothetical protein [Deltaproteobacteria bacterium]
MREQEMRARLARVIDDIDAGRLRPVNGAGRYLGSTVLVATMSLSGCAKDGSVEPAPPPDQTATAVVEPEPVAEYAAVDPEPMPMYAAIMPSAEPSASASTGATASAAPTAAPTTKPTPTTKDVPTATRTIRHPPLPYMAPDP